jgi:hypothetical protein
MCVNCHEQLDRGVLREFEFEIVLADLMAASDEYSHVKMEGALSTGGVDHGAPDIVAKSADGSVTYVVECRSAQTIGSSRLRAAIEQLKRYETSQEQRHLILAFPARLTTSQKELATSLGVDVWDLDEIAARFSAELEGVTHPVLRPLLLAAAALNRADAESPEGRLLRELRTLKPGRPAWSAFQKLVGRILERLFCPPLSSPILNLADAPDVNRRDIILPNYAQDGFWKFVRQRYAADYIVADAKNYSEEVRKPDALQVLNYLKRHGAGQLGLIVSRKGADDGCMATIREHWAHSEKLLIVLSDEHVERMLQAKEAGGPPEDVVRQWIEDFRLSM